MIFNKVILKVLGITICFIFLPLNIMGEEIDNLDKDVLVEKAKVQFLLKNYEGAFQIAEKVLKEDSNNIDALIIASQFHYIKGRFEKAKEYFERIFAVEPISRKIFLRDYGIVLKSSGDLWGAKKCIEEYVSENPEDSLAGYHLGEIYYNLGERDKAEVELKKVYSKKDDQMVLAAILLSELYISQNRNTEAQEILKGLERDRLSNLSDQIVSGLYGKASLAREQYKRLSIDLFVGAGFDTNGVYLTEAEKDERVDKDSGFSEIFANLVYNPLMDGRKRLYLSFNVSKNFYFDDEVKQFDQLFLNPKVGYRFFTSNDRTTLLNFGYEYINLFFSGGKRVGFNSFDSFYQSNSLFAELNHKFGSTTGIVRYRFSFDEFADHNKSGFNHRLFLISSFPVLGKLNLYIGPVLGLEDAKLNIYDQFSAGATAGMQLRTSDTLSIVLSAAYENRNFFDNKENRNDNTLNISSAFEYFLTKYIYLRTSASYSLVDSSLKNYAYDKWVFSLGSGFYY